MLFQCALLQPPPHCAKSPQGWDEIQHHPHTYSAFVLGSLTGHETLNRDVTPTYPTPFAERKQHERVATTTATCDKS